MKPYLLDINVLIALAWPNHVHHHEVQRWFAGKAAAGFRTCPITQTGFVRISSNPAFSPAAVTPNEALELLSRIVQMPGHDFWSDDLSLQKAAESAPALMGHRQVTDAYLIALSEAHGGILATLDRGLTGLVRQRQELIEVVE